MFASTILNSMDRQAIALVKPTVVAEFHHANEWFGWVLAAFQLTDGAVPGPGRLPDRPGGRAAETTQRRSGGGRWRALGAAVGAILTPLTIPLLTESFGWRAAFVVIGALGFTWIGAWLIATGGTHARRFAGHPETATPPADDELAGPGARPTAPALGALAGLLVVVVLVADWAVRFGAPAIWWGVALAMIGVLVVARALPPAVPGAGAGRVAIAGGSALDGAGGMCQDPSGSDRGAAPAAGGAGAGVRGPDDGPSCLPQVVRGDHIGLLAPGLRGGAEAPGGGRLRTNAGGQSRRHPLGHSDPTARRRRPGRAPADPAPRRAQRGGGRDRAEPGRGTA